MRPLKHGVWLVSFVGSFVASLGACNRSNEPACAPCRAGFASDAAASREMALLWQRFEAEHQGADVVCGLPALDLGCACFGSGPSAQWEGENLYLPSAWSRQEQTARAAHLALHRARPVWTAKPALDCDASVALAVDAEAEAHALELEVRRALRVDPLRYPFEAEYFEHAPEQRRSWLRGYFVAHPDGDGVVPGFAALYRQRCSAPPNQGNEQNQ